MVHAIAETDQRGQLANSLPVLRIDASAFRAVQQRQLNVFQNRVLRDQVVRLKDEADQPVADFRQLFVAELRDLLPAEDVLPMRWPIEGAKQIQQRTLPLPDEPMIAMKSPLGTSSDTPRSAFTTTEPRSYHL